MNLICPGWPIRSARVEEGASIFLQTVFVRRKIAGLPEWCGSTSCSASLETLPIFRSQLPYPGIPEPPIKLAPMFDEVPLPSWPNIAQTPSSIPSYDDNYPKTSSNDYNTKDAALPDYFDDLPSAIMNHFRTSTPRPFYDNTNVSPTPYQTESYDSTPNTCSDGDFFSPCNPHLPSFSIKELSRLSMRGFKTSPSISVTPKAPSRFQPPSGRVPYPSYRPEYEGTQAKFEPLPYTPRQYIPSSTMRPRTSEKEKSKPKFQSSTPTRPYKNASEIRTYRPRQKIPKPIPSRPAISNIRNTTRPSYTELKRNLTKIRNKLRNLDQSTQPPLEPSLRLEDQLSKKPKHMSWESWYQQLRTNGLRRYPNNPINPQLPVTSRPKTQNTVTTSRQPLEPDDYFTIKDRALGSSPTLSLSSLVLLIVISVDFIVHN